MIPVDSRNPDEISPGEPIWIRAVLWPFRVPILAGLAAAMLVVLSLFCALIAGPLRAPVAWGLSAVFGVVAAILAAALAIRRLRSTQVAAWGMEHYRQAATGSTAFIIACFCMIYGW